MPSVFEEADCNVLPMIQVEKFAELSIVEVWTNQIETFRFGEEM